MSISTRVQTCWDFLAQRGVSPGGVSQSDVSLGRASAKQKLSSHCNMGWIDNYRSRRASGRDKPASTFIEAARQRWIQLGEELKADVEEFSAQHSGAEFSTSGDDIYRVLYSESGLELEIAADFDAQLVRYHYKPISNTAGAPEGGILSMRQSRRGGVEFYSADERLTSEETRQVLLEPVLFPPQLAA